MYEFAFLFPIWHLIEVKFLSKSDLQHSTYHSRYEPPGTFWTTGHSTSGLQFLHVWMVIEFIKTQRSIFIVNNTMKENGFFH